MDVTFYTYGPETGSSHLMCQDMARICDGQGHTAHVVTKVGDIPGSDLVVVNHPKDILKVLKHKRYCRIDNVVTLFSPHPHGFSKAEMAMMLMTAYDTPMICHSEYLYGLITAQVKELFAPAIARQILGNQLHYVPFGIIDGFSDSGENDKTTFVAPFNRVDRGFKRFDMHSDLTLKLHLMAKKKLGLDLTTVFRHATPDLANLEGADTSMYSLEPQATEREVYMQQAKHYGMFIATSKMESFGLYYLELLASGAVGIFIDEPWVRRLLPDYKLVAKKDDLVPMALSVLNDYDRAKEYLKAEVQPYIQEHYNLERFVARLLGFAKERQQ